MLRTTIAPLSLFLAQPLRQSLSGRVAFAHGNERFLHASKSLNKPSWGGGKLKTHSGTSKRFTPLGKRLAAGPVSMMETFGEVSPHTVPVATWRRYGTMFKRAQTGKQHLNSNFGAARGTRLRRQKLHRSGPTVRVLTRLLGGN